MLPAGGCYGGMWLPPARGFAVVALAFVASMFEGCLARDQHQLGNTFGRIGVAITITADPAEGMEGPAVLMESLVQAMLSSSYTVDYIAIVHPSVSQVNRKRLEQIGWRVLERDLPFAVEDIKQPFLREEVRKSGCCGEREMLKLHAYLMTEYHRVVHLDTDWILLQPIDELLSGSASCVYTEDETLKPRPEDTAPANGGFLVIQPSVRVFNHLFNIFKEGDFRPGLGWGDSRIGWFWGGQTVQGILPYYYHAIAGAHHPRGPTHEVADMCVYNNMMDNDRCRAVPLSNIKGFHFTWCQKPWICSFKWHERGNPCYGVHGEWMRLWHQARLRLAEPGLPPRQRAERVGAIPDLDRRSVVCGGEGPQNYRSMFSGLDL